MELSTKNKRLLEYRMGQLFGGVITAQQFLAYNAEIYIQDVNEKVQFLMEQGFTHHGAILDIYNLDDKESLPF